MDESIEEMRRERLQAGIHEDLQNEIGEEIQSDLDRLLIVEYIEE